MSLRAWTHAVDRLAATPLDGETTAYLNRQPGGWACTTVVQVFRAPLVAGEPLDAQVTRLLRQVPPTATTAHVTVTQHAGTAPAAVEVRVYQPNGMPPGAVSAP